MPAKKANRRVGGKWSGRHTTVTTLAGKVGDFLESLEFVKKIATGRLVNGGRIGQPRIRAISGDTSVEVTCIQSRCLQKLFVFSTDHDAVLAALKQEFAIEE